MTLKEIFKRQKIDGKQVLGPGWFFLFILILSILSIWGIIVIWVS